MSLIFRSIFILLCGVSSVWATAPALDIAKTVIKLPLVEDVSMDDAIDSMKLRANALNMKLVAHQPLSRELKAQGMKDVRRMEIFQFCDPKIAKEIVEYSMDFAAYLPCRITLVEDEKGQGWLVMMNIDLFLQAAQLPENLKVLGSKVRDSMNEIMNAGANGDL